MKKALLVIDVQHFFLNPLTKDLPGKMSQYVEKHRKDFDLIVFTKFVNTPMSNTYRLLDWREFMKSPDTDFMEELRPVLKYGTTIEKDVLSALKVPNIKKLLVEHKITDVFLCGIDTDCCVLATAYDAFDQGYRITVLSDLSMTHTGKNLHDAGLIMIEKNIGTVEKTGE